jgi:hypothetical protein
MHRAGSTANRAKTSRVAPGRGPRRGRAQGSARNAPGVREQAAAPGAMPGRRALAELKVAAMGTPDRAQGRVVGTGWRAGAGCRAGRGQARRGGLG